jgi:hypothetical protein
VAREADFRLNRRGQPFAFDIVSEVPFVTGPHYDVNLTHVGSGGATGLAFFAESYSVISAAFDYSLPAHSGV